MDALSARRRSIVRRTRAANLFGAVMAFVYFRFIDPMTAGPEVAWPEIVFSVVAFTGLTLVGESLNDLLNPVLRKRQLLPVNIVDDDAEAQSEVASEQPA